jgi:hypothetical protein
MRNWTPIFITTYEGESNYASLWQYTCIGLANMWNSPAPSSLFTLINDFSLSDPEPTTLAGCFPKTATLLPYGVVFGTERIACENKLIARNYSWRFGETEYNQFQRWRMAQGMPAEGTPEIDNLYAPENLDQWKAQFLTYSCNALLDAFDIDHPALFGSFWHPSIHQSWIDFVKCDFSSIDVWRENIIRCRTFSPMKVPLYGTQWSYYLDRYSIEIRSLPELTGTEFAKFVMEESNYDDFREGIYTVSSTGFLSEYGPPYQYHRQIIGKIKMRNSGRYTRWKCQVWDYIDSVLTLIRESAWSSTLDLTYAYYNITNDELLYQTPQFIPYYAYLTSDGTINGYSAWHFHITTLDEDTINYRLQVSVDPDFSTTYVNTTIIALFGGNSENTDWELYSSQKYASQTVSLPNVPADEEVPHDNYYCRVRGENADSSVVSEWSEVFTLTYTPHTGYTTSGYIGISGSYVEETHDTSVGSYAEEQEFIVDEEITIATILEDSILYLYTLESDGSGFTKTEVPNSHGSSGSVNLYNFIRFGGKVYALYSEWWQDENYVEHYLYGWREITGGTLGTLHEYSYPATGYRYSAWTFLTNLYGHLQLCSSLSDKELLYDWEWGMPIDNDNKFRFGTMAILEDETEFTVHEDIVTGRTYSVDPWHGSFWYEYDGRFETENLGYRIAWLKGKDPDLFPWVGKFQLKKVEEVT